jgi:hypothetical protein
VSDESVEVCEELRNLQENVFCVCGYTK